MSGRTFSEGSANVRHTPRARAMSQKRLWSRCCMPMGSAWLDMSSKDWHKGTKRLSKVPRWSIMSEWARNWGYTQVSCNWYSQVSERVACRMREVNWIGVIVNSIQRLGRSIQGRRRWRAWGRHLPLRWLWRDSFEGYPEIRRCSLSPKLNRIHPILLNFLQMQAS